MPGLRQQPEQLPRVKLDVVVALDHVPRRPAPSLAPDVAAQDLAITVILEYNISNGQLSDVTWSAHVMGRYLANAIISDKSK